MQRAHSRSFGAAESRAIEWLMQEGGPVIRYRTATELADAPGAAERKRLERALIESRLVRLWLGRLRPDTGFGD